MTKEELQQLANLLSGNTANKQKLSINIAWNNFINYKKGNVRIKTLEYYEKTFKNVEKYLKEININYIEDINKQVMNSMLISFKTTIRKNGRTWSNATINDNIDIIKQVVKFNYDNEFIEENKISNFKKLTEDTPETIIVNDNNEEKIIKYLKSLDLNKGKNLRNILIIYLLRDSGIRNNELLNIETKNINLEERSIFLTFTKTKKKEHIFFSEETKQLLIKYLEKVKNDKYLFSSKNSQEPLKRGRVYEFLESIRRKLNIEESISSHKWRHTLGTKLSYEDINSFTIQKILRHRHVSTTERYVHTKNDKIKKDLDKVYSKFKK